MGVLILYTEVGNDISDVIIFNFVNGYSTTKILDKMK